MRFSRTAISTLLFLIFVLFLSHSVHAAPAKERTVTFTNGNVTLHGTLLLPAGEGPFPAVVFLHGSGPATRAGARPYADAFADMGVASLIFDKRGSGESGGKWTEASIEDLANDALAALQFVRGQRGISADRVGYWGVSQAAWVATLAASKSPDVGFLMLVSGGGATPQESERFSYDVAFAEAGLSAEEVKEARGALDVYFEYLAKGQGRDSLVALLEAGKQTRWKPLAEQLLQILPSQQGLRHWSWVATFDPRPHIERIKVPTLLMFGEKDRDHPTELAVLRWREGLQEAGNPDFEIVIFPGAGHGIRMRDGFKGPGRPPFADGYDEVLMGWLWLHVVNPPPKQE